MAATITRHFLGALVVGAALIGASPAHEEGVLRLPSRMLVAGDSVRLRGENFGGSVRLRLRLTGVAGTVAVTTVRADTAGAFTSWVTVPGSVAAGAWRLIAVADDDDVVASLEVQVTAAAPAAHDMAGMDDLAGMDHEDGMPTGEPLVLDRARSPAVDWGVRLGILVTAALGLALLRRSEST